MFLVARDLVARLKRMGLSTPGLLNSYLQDEYPTISREASRTDYMTPSHGDIEIVERPDAADETGGAVAMAYQRRPRF